MMWRVRSSSLSLRVRSCFLMRSRSYSSTEKQPAKPVCSCVAHPEPVEVQRRLVLVHERRGALERLEVRARPARRRAASYGWVSGGRSISDRVTRRKLSGLPAASARASSALTTSYGTDGTRAATSRRRTQGAERKQERPSGTYFGRDAGTLGGGCAASPRPRPDRAAAASTDRARSQNVVEAVARDRLARGHPAELEHAD